MVRKSILVYDLLRTEQPLNGFSEREIVEQISNRHDIAVGKGFRRQVAVALRRGLDFGILTKKNNKFRFDPENAMVKNEGRRIARKPKPKRKTEKKKKTGKSKQRNARTKTRKQSRQTSRPAMPKYWTPARRNLAEEPMPKVKKV
ncbi:uncharacterized protein LOC143212781 [Lasioglossum baleicum]|uniref:uncharacterized protein LOC143212781 n=1 Tax=Lasioglossum baleicum TaxID=434251 RepID=UPI003FCD514C